jgi:hypothetical protein
MGFYRRIRPMFSTIESHYPQDVVGAVRKYAFGCIICPRVLTCTLKERRAPRNSGTQGGDGGAVVWIHVIPHFSGFLQELFLTPDDHRDATGKADRVARSLFARYYPDQIFTSNCYKIVGSYGRETAGRPCTDVDMLFLLPITEWSRVNQRQGNKQSQLLQEVKDTLLYTFPRTALRADGQVVMAPFDTYAVEIAPAFARTDGTFLTCDTNDGGSWRVSNPDAEYDHLHNADLATNWKATRLTLMAKAWARECNVELKSTSIEVLASIFVSQWPHRIYDLYWYDWMIRDFFAFLHNYVVGGWTRIVGTEDKIQLGDAWVSKLETAYARALKACEYERADDGDAAAREWRKIFGSQFPGPIDYLTLLAKLSARAKVGV